MKASDRYFNRELAWLEFNQRVLDEACDTSVPLAERVKFLAITASNLDEFFRVRVGELTRLADSGSTRRDPSGRTPFEQLGDVRERAGTMLADIDTCYGELELALAELGFARKAFHELPMEQRERAVRFFDERVLPTLSPFAVDLPDDDHGTGIGSASIHLPGEMVTLAVQLQANDLFGGESRFALVPFGGNLHRFFYVDDGYVLLEDLVTACVQKFFVGQTVAEVAPFRITRDADITLDDDEADDIVEDMRDVLDARKRGRVVRLETASGTGTALLDMLTTLFDVSDPQVNVNHRSPLGLSAWFGLLPRDNTKVPRDADWPTVTPDFGDDGIFAAISESDRLLLHPYETFDPVVQLLEEAADDPDVLSIKQTLYRTAKDSRIVNALIRAAQHGKHVTVLVELKARFDEARNIGRARELEEAGVFVTYGVRGLKTHAKLCLVTRREPGGTVRYVHIGTGNYNESTARLYGDVSLMTRDDDIGRDAVAVFNAITGFSEPHSLRKLRWAPINLRDFAVELIQAEAERARQGQEASILLKLNSLVDPAVIDALYEASTAGVRIDINVRGICCLRPNVPGLSENIRVVRLVDRYLEHARVLVFNNGGEQRVFISSADWMPRNLDRRIELLTPVEHLPAKQKLIRMVQLCLADTAKATLVEADGGQRRIKPKKTEEAIRAQQTLSHQAAKATSDTEAPARTMFKPHVAHS